MEIGDLKSTRWRRYGKDRLYVEHSDGTKVGWWDLVSSEAHPETPGSLEPLMSAVVQWKSVHSAAQPIQVRPVAQPELDQGDQDFVEHLPASIGACGPAENHGSAPARDATGHQAPTSVPRPWLDLATNRAGGAARTQAQALRAAAPVKTTLARVLGVHTDERAWRIGADGEELVAAQLAKTAKRDPRWKALHAIPLGDRGSDIDHLIIGPGGIFAVNAKHHPQAKIWVGGNTFMVNGRRQPYIHHSRHEAQRVTRLLSASCGFPVHAEGLIVTVNAADVIVKTQPDGVHVTWRNNLAKWLLRLGDIYAPDVLDAVYDAARRSTTWQR